MAALSILAKEPDGGMGALCVCNHFFVPLPTLIMWEEIYLYCTAYAWPAEFLSCSGFSKQMVNLLQELNVEFSSFNILMDDEVRKGMWIHV